MAETLKKGWRRVAFGDVVRQVRDRVDPEDTDIERFVAGEHMDTDDLRIRRWGLIGDGYLGPAFHMRFKPGQVLYGSRRTYLRKVALADFEGITANTTFVLETKDPRVMLPELLPFIMQTESFHEHSIKQSKGSVNPYINFSDLTWYEFALPPLKEQRRIAEVLGALSTLYESNRVLLEKAWTTYRAYLLSLRSSSVMKQVRLDSLLIAIEPGKSVSGNSHPPSSNEYGVLKVSAVDPNGFLAQESKRLLNDKDFRSEFSIKAGDLLMTRANTPELVGEVCLVESNHPNLMLCDKTLRLKPAPDIDSYLLWESLQSREIRRQLTSVATGTGRSMKNISQNKIRDLLVDYPKNPKAATQIKSALFLHRHTIRLIQKRLDNCNMLLSFFREGLLNR